SAKSIEPEPVCASCGHPRRGHNYRHQFKPVVPKAGVVAIKKRLTPSNAWMPEECHVRLEGDPDPKGRSLFVCGWSTAPDTQSWRKTRLERCLPKLVQQWEEDFGKGWRLEIR